MAPDLDYDWLVIGSGFGGSTSALRLREKGIPNAAVPGVYGAGWLTALDTRLVHLEVSDEAISVAAAQLADAEAFWAAHRPDVRPPTPSTPRRRSRRARPPSRCRRRLALSASAVIRLRRCG